MAVLTATLASDRGWVPLPTRATLARLGASTPAGSGPRTGEPTVAAGDPLLTCGRRRAGVRSCRELVV